jgi:hypothetical protein
MLSILITFNSVRPLSALLLFTDMAPFTVSSLHVLGKKQPTSKMETQENHSNSTSLKCLIIIHPKSFQYMPHNYHYSHSDHAHVHQYKKKSVCKNSKRTNLTIMASNPSSTIDGPYGSIMGCTSTSSAGFNDCKIHGNLSKCTRILE